MTLPFETHTLWLSTCEISYWWNVLLLDVWSLYNTNHVSFDEMTQTPHYGAVWKSCLMIKCMWNFILMKYIVTRCFDLYTIRIMFRLTRLKLHVMESMPDWWDHTDDFNILKGLCFKLLSIIHVDVKFIEVVDIIISHFWLEIQSEYLYLWGFEFIWWFQKILEMKKEL
jgi:hypothetical protein